MQRHPFGRIPAFQHDDFHLYETGAIVRYSDDAFPRCTLQPTSPKTRAKVNQIVGILDAYAYRTLVWDIYVERVVSARQGRLANEQTIAAALPRAALCLSELTRLSDDKGFLIGGSVTLADLYAAPIFAYFMRAPEAVSLMEGCEKLIYWWQRFAIRDSMCRLRDSGLLQRLRKVFCRALRSRPALFDKKGISLADCFSQCWRSSAR